MNSWIISKYKSILFLLLLIGFSVLIIIFSNKLQELRQFGYLGVFLVMFLGNATLFVPIPILAPLNILFGGTLTSPLIVGLSAGIGSSLGELVGYLAGYSGSTLLKDSKYYEYIKSKFQKYGLIVIFVLALVPNPFFDIGGLVSGASHIKWWKFLLFTILGKTIRTTLLAYIGYGTKWIF